MNMNNTINILINVFWCTYTTHFLYKCIYRAIARTQEACMFSFSRYCQTVFQMVLPLPSVVFVSFSCSTCLATLGFVSLLNFSHSVGGLLVFPCGFDLHFLEQLVFMYLFFKPQSLSFGEHLCSVAWWLGFWGPVCAAWGRFPVPSCASCMMLVSHGLPEPHSLSLPVVGVHDNSFTRRLVGEIHEVDT